MGEEEAELETRSGKISSALFVIGNEEYEREVKYFPSLRDDGGESRSEANVLESEVRTGKPPLNSLAKSSGLT